MLSRGLLSVAQGVHDGSTWPVVFVWLNFTSGGRDQVGKVRRQRGC